MPWVRFRERFDFDPRPGVTIAYPANYAGLVTTACRKAAGVRCVTIKKSEVNAGGTDARSSGRGDARAG